MSLIDEVRRELRELRKWVSDRLETQLGWTLTAANTAMGDGDQVETGDGEDTQRGVRRIEPFGLRSRPPTKIRSLWFRLGTSNVVFLGIAPTKAYGPTALNEGETALYNSVEKVAVLLDKDGKITINAGDSTIKITKDGKIEIDAKSPADVIVNGGTLEVARHSDRTSASAPMSTWAGQVDTCLQSLVTATGSGTVPSPVFNNGVTGPGADKKFGIIAEGAGHFKG